MHRLHALNNLKLIICLPGVHMFVGSLMQFGFAIDAGNFNSVKFMLKFLFFLI